MTRRMSKAGVAGRGVTLKLKMSGFRTVTRAHRLRDATRSAKGMFQAAEPLLAHDLVKPEQAAQGDLLGADSPDSGIDKAPAVREKFGDDAIVRGRGFGMKLERQGPSNTG